MLKVIQYLKGYVVIKVWGFSPERFMNLCSNHHIFLWDILNCGEYYIMSISIKDFYKLKPITRKTGTRVVIQERCGLPFFVSRIKRRKIFIAGLLGSLLFWMWMSGYIWAIEIQGNYYVTDDVLMDFMSENDIRVGMKRSALSIEELEKSLRKQYDIVTWTSARIDGTRLVIQIKENDLLETNVREETQEGVGYDLVAEKDGTVVSIITRTGFPLVVAGSPVVKGDVLVEGGLPIYNEDTTVKRYQFCKSDADIYLQCQYELQETLPIVLEEKIYTESQKKVPILELFGRRIKLQLGQSGYQLYDTVEDIRQVKLLDNFYLPIYYGSESIREYQLIPRNYSNDEVKEIFSLKLKKYMQTLEEKGVQIIEKNVTINKNSKNWYMNVTFEVVEKTGQIQLTRLETPQIPENQQSLEGGETVTETMSETVWSDEGDMITD